MMKLDLDIHNFYEHLVVENIENNKLASKYDTEQLGDICCLALTQLPARYIRHDIDMAFFLGTAEREKMQADVNQAILKAADYLAKKNRD